MRASFYPTDGIVLRPMPDGSLEQVTWHGVNGETDHKCYSIRQYEGGLIEFLVNHSRVESLPNTPVARETFSRFLSKTAATEDSQ
jgi:hypothetical protein